LSTQTPCSAHFRKHAVHISTVEDYHECTCCASAGAKSHVVSAGPITVQCSLFRHGSERMQSMARGHELLAATTKSAFQC
jgi:hypothetical protein